MKTTYLTLLIALLANIAFAVPNKVSIQDSSFVKVKIVKDGEVIDTTIRVASKMDVDVDEIMTTIDIDEKDGIILVKTNACKGHDKYMEILVSDDEDVTVLLGEDNNTVVKRVIKSKYHKHKDGDSNHVSIENDDKKKRKTKSKKKTQMVTLNISKLTKEEKQEFQKNMPIEGKEKLDIEAFEILYKDEEMNLIFELADEEDLSVEVFNTKGEQLIIMAFQSFEGKFDSAFKLDESGTYILKIRSGKKFLTRKIDLEIVNS